MDSTISSAPPVRPDVVSVETTARPTAARVPFSDVLAGGARALVQGAQSTVQSLPGSPLMALAVRPGASIVAPSALTGGISAGGSPEGPGGSVVGSSAAVGGLSTSATGASATTDGAGTSSDQSMQATMAQDQAMNIYYLQIQEEVNAQNRTFSALSNVMEVEHSTAKTAIGNIH